MRKLVLLLATFSLNFFYSQTEISVEVNSGLFSFGGSSSAKNSMIIVNEGWSNSKYTNNPYGKNADLALVLSINFKKVFKNKLFIGSSLGYEILKSKMNVTEVFLNTDYNSPQQLSASGKTNLTYNNINFYPYFGYRIPAKSINFDISAGADFGFILSAKEKGSAKASNGITYETSLDRKTISTDFRPRIQLDAHYQKFGVYLGYSFGTINYMKDYIGGNFDTKSRMLRFGLTYQLN